MRRLLTICCAVGVLLLGSTEGNAFDAEDLEKLKSTGSCPNCELRNANLQNANLTYAKLQKADLRGANLQQAHLVGADFQEADLRVAYIGGANLQGADLRVANLEGGKHDIIGLAKAPSVWPPAKPKRRMYNPGQDTPDIAPRLSQNHHVKPLGVDGSSGVSGWSVS